MIHCNKYAKRNKHAVCQLRQTDHVGRQENFAGNTLETEVFAEINVANPLVGDDRRSVPLGDDTTIADDIG